MITITIETIGDERFVRAFDRIASDIKDMRGAFELIWEDFVEIEQRIFDNSGPGWVPLSPAYAAWKEKHYPGEPLMRLTHRLVNSLTGVDQADSQDTVKDIRALEATFGTRVPHALAHQRGVPGRLPQRKVVSLAETDKRRWSLIIHRWVVNEMREALT